ncbi:MAG: 3-isopropylmalate dehydratase small subunit [Gaiellales bacterium]
MRSFERVTSRVAVIDRPNVDTDQIIPKQFLKRIERTGWGQFLFHDWRRDDDGNPDPDFELHNPADEGAKILIAGETFGCGSSREHAPWALQDYGFEVLIAPSYADIFVSNCVKIGLVPIVLDAVRVRELVDAIDHAEGSTMTVDLVEQQIMGPAGELLHFEFDEHQRHKILNGLDDIGLTLQLEEAVAAFEASHEPGIDTLALPK